MDIKLGNDIALNIKNWNIMKRGCVVVDMILITSVDSHMEGFELNFVVSPVGQIAAFYKPADYLTFNHVKGK